jgi:hypothetical protein
MVNGLSFFFFFSFFFLFLFLFSFSFLFFFFLFLFYFYFHIFLSLKRLKTTTTTTTTTKKKKLGYNCSCLNGFNGTNCENNIDDCYGVVCMNGGSCVDKVQNFECMCTEGWKGINCGEMVTCSAQVISQDYTSFPICQAGQACYGNCSDGYYGNPTRYCRKNNGTGQGYWDEIQNTCERYACPGKTFFKNKIIKNKKKLN